MSKVVRISKKREKEKLENTSTEHQIQSAFIYWVRLNEKKYLELRLLFAVPNGGVRNIATAARLKKEGVNPGIPDIIFPVPRRSFTGFAIEFKRPRGIVSKKQKEKIEMLRKENWSVHVIDNTMDAIELLRWYIGDSA